MGNNKMQVFTNETFGQIRTLNENGNILFCGSDVAKALGYAEPHKAIARHCPHGMKRTIGVKTGEMPNGDEITQQIEMLFIPESDLYRMIFSSKLPSAEKFTDWVTEEVLPAIRKTGYYAVPQDYISALRAYADELERNQQLEAENQEQKLVIGMQEQEIADLRPMKTYVDTILESTDTLTVTQIAADYGLTAQKLNKILKNENVQRKVGGQWVLKANQMGQGYTDSKTVKITHTDGTTGTVLQTRWTQKGRLFIHEILSKHGIVALMDREEYDE